MDPMDVDPSPNPSPASPPPTSPGNILSQVNPEVRRLVTDALKRVQDTIGSWKPHPFSSEERAEYFEHTRQLIHTISEISATKDSIRPSIDHNLEMSLFEARIDYRATFPRLFRFHDLPTEIVNEIFRNVAWSGTDSTSARTRLWLTWVCKRWRSIALEDPHLWNVIWWQDEPDFVRSQVFFDRAADAPKDLRINDDPKSPMSMETIKLIMGKIIPRLHTVRVLIVILHEWDPLLFIVDQLRVASLIDGPLVMERLEIHRNGPPYIQLGAGYTGPYRQAIPLFDGRNVPSLRTLSLSGIHIDWNNTSVGNLVALDLRKVPLNRAPTFEQFRAVLKSSPMLNKLILDGAGPSFVGRDPSNTTIDYPPIPLLHLRTLALADFSAPYATYVVSQFSVPNVRDLTVLNLQGQDYTQFFLAMVGKMKEVRVLTLFNAELLERPIGPDGAREPDEASRLAVVRWLESMPQIAFIRFGALHPNFLDNFLADPNSIKPKDRLFPENNVILPKLKFLEWQRMQPIIVINWAMARKDRFNLPLEKIYINQATAEEINGDRTISESMKACMGGKGGVFLLRPGHKAPEENILQNQ